MKDLHEVRTELTNKSAKRRLTMQERKAIKAEKDEVCRVPTFDHLLSIHGDYITHKCRLIGILSW